MKLMVSGIGGVGGYIAAVLCRYYPGSVTLIARGERKKALEPVSYTHLDVYKRQLYLTCSACVVIYKP